MSADLLARLKLDQLNAQKQRKILEVLLRQEINADIRYSYLKILRKADERIMYNQEIINQFVLTWRRINANQYIHAEHISESDSIDGNMIWGRLTDDSESTEYSSQFTSTSDTEF